MSEILQTILNSITFRLPYYTLRGLMLLLCGGRREEIWNVFPFKNMRSLLLLPDGNLLYCPWRDGYYWAWAIIKEIHYDRVYEQFFKPKIGFTVVDVGAHIGIYTLRAAKEVGEKGWVIAIEPEERNYNSLAKNVRINKYKNVVPLKLAISNFEGKARLYVKSSTLSHSLSEHVELHQRANIQIFDVVEVTVTTLTGLMKKLGVTRIDLLKVDTEGVELEVLMGSERLLSELMISNIVIASYHVTEEDKAIKNYLEKFGYKVRVIEIGGRKYVHAVVVKQRDNVAYT